MIVAVRLVIMCRLFGIVPLLTGRGRRLALLGRKPCILVTAVVTVPGMAPRLLGRRLKMALGSHAYKKYRQSDE